ncbi:hypothetical protein ACI6BU_22540 [Lysinibacillus boronitolerans]
MQKRNSESRNFEMMGKYQGLLGIEGIQNEPTQQEIIIVPSQNAFCQYFNRQGK